MNKLNEEVWVPVKKYEGLYEINQDSVVRSLNKRNFHKIMPQRIDRGGYLTVRLSNKGKDCTVYVHRLLGFAFLDNPENKCCINHIDGNKRNNDLSNLEWVTMAENMQHAYRLGLIVDFPGKCRKVIDKCSGAVFESIKMAADFYMIPYSTCKNYINGNRQNPTCLSYLNTKAA